jgi:hypothetical protein
MSLIEEENVLCPVYFYFSIKYSIYIPVTYSFSSSSNTEGVEIQPCKYFFLFCSKFNWRLRFLQLKLIWMEKKENIFSQDAPNSHQRFIKSALTWVKSPVPMFILKLRAWQSRGRSLGSWEPSFLGRNQVLSKNCLGPWFLGPLFCCPWFLDPWFCSTWYLIPRLLGTWFPSGNERFPKPSDFPLDEKLKFHF